MIPDNISFTSAIVAYIKWKMLDRMSYLGREGTAQRAIKAEQDWHWYCKQASNLDMMPYGIDEHQNLLEQRSYLLPRHNRYYGFFGNLGSSSHPGGSNRGSGDDQITINNIKGNSENWNSTEW